MPSSPHCAAASTRWNGGPMQHPSPSSPRASATAPALSGPPATLYSDTKQIDDNTDPLKSVAFCCISSFADGGRMTSPAAAPAADYLEKCRGLIAAVEAQLPAIGTAADWF